MENEKSYLAPSLSVEDLSRKLNIPARNLSQALHSGLNKNFYDFVNSYRIDEIKKRIQDAQYQNLTLFAIALDAGFNSKSKTESHSFQYVRLPDSGRMISRVLLF